MKNAPPWQDTFLVCEVHPDTGGHCLLCSSVRNTNTSCQILWYANKDQADRCTYDVELTRPSIDRKLPSSPLETGYSLVTHSAGMGP